MFNLDVTIIYFDADVANDANVDADADVEPSFDLLQTFGPIAGALFKFLLIINVK